LEYLESVLPPSIRERLWPFLEDRQTATPASRPRAEILDELVRSNQSIMLNLEELRQQTREWQAKSRKPKADGREPIAGS
jgi:hypothetical protein